MKRRLLLLGLILLLPGLSFSQTTPSTPAPAEATAQRVSAAVVKIFVRNSDGAFVPSGSGFYVKPGLVVSARDAYRDGKTVYLKTPGSEFLRPAKAEPARGESDIDVFRVEGPSVAPLRLARRPARVGEEVVAVGAALFGARASAGTISRLPGREGGVNEPVESARMISFAAEVTAENAGGPLVARDGEVLGITTGIHSANGPTYLAVPASSIAARLAGKSEPGRAASPQPIAPASQPIAPARSEGPGAPSLGPGAGEGMGTGRGGGMGMGTDPGPSPPAKSAPPDPAAKIVTKAVILNRPRPNYTEQARKNLTQGDVMVRVLLGADGQVKSVNVVRGLPDGLNEQAILAARKLQFVPARNAEGQPVNSWVALTVSFSLIGDSLLGVWVGEYDGGRGSIQFFLRTRDGEGFRGLVILETRPGVFVCAPVQGAGDGASFTVRTESPAGGCTAEWVGRRNYNNLLIEETRSCTPGEAPAKLSLKVSRKDWIGDDARPRP